MTHRPNILKGLVAGAVAGLGASYVKSLVEPPLQTLTEQVWPVSAAEHREVGADPKGHQDNMPPAVMVEAAAEKYGDTTLSKDDKLKYQQVIHYALGTFLGAMYGALAEVNPKVTVGFGVPAGAAMYLCTHATAVPATGFQRWPWQLPTAAVAWESGSHLAFGASLEAVRGPLRALLD